jgi:hypothetical protein
VKQGIIRATAGKCEKDLAHYIHATIEAVSTMGLQASIKYNSASEVTLFCAAKLHLFVLPDDFIKLEVAGLPDGGMLLLLCTAMGP